MYGKQAEDTSQALEKFALDYGELMCCRVLDSGSGLKRHPTLYM